MKTRKKNVFVTTIGILLSIGCFVIYSCKKTNTESSPQTSLWSSTVAIQFVDASKGTNIGLTTEGTEDKTYAVTVKVVGPDADKVMGISSGLYSKQGFLSLALKDGVMPTKAKPINFTIVTSAKGYFKYSKPITLIDTGHNSLVVSMVKIDSSNAPQGVGIVRAPAVALNNSYSTTSITTISTPQAKGSDKSIVTISIPTGQQFYSTPVEGQPKQLIKEPIQTNIAHFSAIEGKSLECIPGGLDNVFLNNNSSPVSFKTAGLISIEMTGKNSGQVVTDFKDSIPVTMGIPPTLTNNLGKQVQIGDTIPLWSNSTVTGLWKYEGHATVTAGSGNDLQVTFKITHLSYWNLDWFSTNSCSYGATVNVKSNITNSDYRYYILSSNQSINTLDGYLKSGYMDCENGTNFTFLNALPKQAYLTIYKTCDLNASPISKTVQIDNLCSGNYSVDINLPAPTVINYSVSVKCDSKPEYGTVRPTMEVYAYNLSNYNCLYLGRMIDGKLSTPLLEVGSTYNFYGVLSDKNGKTAVVQLMNKKVNGVNNTELLDCTEGSKL